MTLGTELRSSARAACALNLVSLLRTLTLFLPYLSVSWQGGRRSTDRDFIPWKVLSTFLGPQHLTSTPNLLSLSQSTVGVAPLEGQPHCAFFFPLSQAGFKYGLNEDDLKLLTFLFRVLGLQMCTTPGSSLALARHVFVFNTGVHNLRAVDILYRKKNHLLWGSVPYILSCSAKLLAAPEMCLEYFSLSYYNQKCL